MDYESGARSKPTWLNYYVAFIWAALILSIYTVLRYAPTATLLEWPSMLGRLVIYSYAAYTLRYWETARSRSVNLLLQMTIVVLSIVYFTPLSQLLPPGLYFLYAAVSVPIYSIIPDVSALSRIPFLPAALALFMTFPGALALIMAAISAYFLFCWQKFSLAAKDSVAQREADTKRRRIREIMTKGTIAAFVIGIVALLMGFADGAGPWATIAFVFLVGALLAMIVLQIFGNDPLVDEEIEEPGGDDPLGGNDPDPNEAGRQPSQQQKSTAQKTDIFRKDVSGIAFVLLGVPILLLIVVAAIVMTAASGEGIGMFLVLLVFLIGAALVKLR